MRNMTRWQVEVQTEPAMSGCPRACAIAALVWHSLTWMARCRTAGLSVPTLAESEWKEMCSRSLSHSSRQQLRHSLRRWLWVSWVSLLANWTPSSLSADWMANHSIVYVFYYPNYWLLLKSFGFNCLRLEIVWTSSRLKATEIDLKQLKANWKPTENQLKADSDPSERQSHWTALDSTAMSADSNWRKTMDMSSLLMTTRGQLMVLLIVLALTSCVQQVLSSPRCVALCHRSEADSLCKRCRFREPMRFGKRSDKQAFREPMRFGKRLQRLDEYPDSSDPSDTTFDYGQQYKRSVTLSPRLIRVLMENIWIVFRLRISLWAKWSTDWSEQWPHRRSTVVDTHWSTDRSLFI